MQLVCNQIIASLFIKYTNIIQINQLSRPYKNRLHMLSNDVINKTRQAAKQFYSMQEYAHATHDNSIPFKQSMY